jgi:hypothetical protein
MPASAASDPVSVIVYRPQPVTRHHGEPVAPGRRVVAGPWPFRDPRSCRDPHPDGIWVGPTDRPDQQVLICRGCGLDCT